MDTEEYLEIKEAQSRGTPETDEGPYYHKPWWESYKGSVKGKLGGLAIGAILGAIAGIVAAPFLVSSVIGPLAIIGGFSAAGMLYGLHEFSDIGKIVGANASIAEEQEKRINPRFEELKKGIADIKTMLQGKKADAISAAETAQNNPSHPTQHFDEETHSPTTKFIFWKVAAIGLAVGLAAGAILAWGGFSKEILQAVLPNAAAEIVKVNLMPASMTVLGLFGASFGINRDIFRQIFDKTDLLFKGLLSRSKTLFMGRSPAVESPVMPPAPEASPEITTIAYDNAVGYPTSDRFFRDKVLTQAQQALLSMDTSNQIPN